MSAGRRAYHRDRSKACARPLDPARCFAASMEETAFFALAKPLVLVHAAISIVLIGASTHHLLIAYGYLRGRYQLRLGRLYAVTVGIAYSATMIVGALAYPTYRYHVRALFLDRYEPWASNLFDIKENLATIGLPLALGAWWLSLSFDVEEDRFLQFVYVIMVAVVTAVVWFNVLSGLLVTMVRGV